MGVTKSNLFSQSQNELAQMAKALGHPARIAILEHLSKTNSCINSDLVNELGLAQATISQHLRELKDLGFIQGSIEGVSVCYCINAEKWKQINRIFEQFFKQFPNQSNTNCC
ncbi:ArsR/SmtB family transcription factor [Aquirufa sp. ROCK-SH2]